MNFRRSSIRRYFGTAEFYRRVALLSIPLALQQLFSSAMGIVDTIMVAKIGQVTAVGTAAQVEAMMLTVCFGAASGATIFMTQFYGAQDEKNLKRSFGLGLLMVTCISLFWAVLALVCNRHLIGFYIGDAAVINTAGLYLSLALFSYIPNALSMMFSYAYRCIQTTVEPLVFGTVTMICKIALSYVLIFGAFGIPAMGVTGAALSTLISQTLVLAAHVIYAYVTKQAFIGSLRELFGFDKSFVRKVLHRSLPLIFNETFFALGSTMYIKAFGFLGAQAMESYYVGNEIANVFLFMINGVSNANAAILGKELGSGTLTEAKKMGNYFISMAVWMSLFTVVLILSTARPLVSLFALKDAGVIRESVLIVQVFSVRLSLRLFNVIIFASLRAGGDSKFLAFLDSGILWLVGLPVAFFLVGGLHMTSIAEVFLLVQIEQLVRVVIGLHRYFKGTWIRNLTLEIN